MTMFRRLALLLTLIAGLGAPAVGAPTVAGDWHGRLEVPGGSLRIVVHLTDKGGTLDSPDQGVKGLEIGTLEAAGDSLKFTVPKVQGAFAGRWNEGTWVGSWTQGSSLPLILQPLSQPLGKTDTASAADDPTTALARLVGEREGVFAALVTVDPKGVTIERSASLGEDRRFEIGSLTKTFTGLLLAEMVRAGKVKLDDPVALYLPPDALAPELRPITLGQLSRHTSGLPRLPSNLVVTPIDPYASYDEAKLLEFLKTAKPDSTPGTKVAYSNLGAGLLGYALGRADGRGYRAALAARVLGPLGMKDTDCTLDQRSLVGIGPGGPAKPWTFDVLGPAGCLRSTAKDMARFAAALVDPNSPIAADFALMQKDLVADGKMKAGLGIFQVPAGKDHWWFHNGATGSFRSSMFIDPSSRTAMVLLMNAAMPDPDPITARLLASRVAEKR